MIICTGHSKVARDLNPRVHSILGSLDQGPPPDVAVWGPFDSGALRTGLGISQSGAMASTKLLKNVAIADDQDDIKKYFDGKI